MSPKDSLSSEIAIEERTGRTMDRLSRIFHPRAWLEIVQDQEVLKRLMWWIHHRFEAVQIDEKDRVTFKRNPLNASGVGMQEVSVCVRRPRKFFKWRDPEDRFLKNEQEHPVLTVVTSGLLNGSPRLCIVDFDIEEGGLYRMTNFTPGFKIGVGESDSSVTEATELPQVAEIGKPFLLGHPATLRTLVELKDPPDLAWFRGTSNHGVYVREVLKAAKT